MYKTWKVDSQIDSFKFLIRFLSHIEKYVVSLDISIDLDNMIAKIGALYLPYEIKEDIISLIRIREKAVSQYYELTEKDEKLLEKTYTELTMELIFQELASLHLNKLNIKEDPNALDKQLYYLEFKELLHNYVKNTFYIHEDTSYFIITMLNRLKITLS